MGYSPICRLQSVFCEYLCNVMLLAYELDFIWELAVIWIDSCDFSYLAKPSGLDLIADLELACIYKHYLLSPHGRWLLCSSNWLPHSGQYAQRQTGSQSSPGPEPQSSHGSALATKFSSCSSVVCVIASSVPQNVHGLPLTLAGVLGI